MLQIRLIQLILGIGSFEGGTLTATCSFGDSESKSIKMPIQFDVIDTNADNKANFFNKFEGCEAVEKSSLTDAKITEETKTTDLTDASINPKTQQNPILILCLPMPFMSK